ncbi:MAG: anaerobic ribonucleoside-triphosphate reductase activating protein [Lachnospiraceae bacterium]|nr:anaerobic ribonucleoside-triphosphate reductase activating protein [Lachnospiraceae bacterium]
MLLLGLNKTTLLDYPGCVAATVFTGGCNFRCPFCQNGGLVLEPAAGEALSEEELFSFLKKRKNILKGVCITGGEPAIQADLPDFLVRIKELGYRIKLDTNGYQPEALKRLMREGLLDYVAMDIKNCPDKYAVTVGRDCADGFDVGRIHESIHLLLDGGIQYEFRTTVVKELHTLEDLMKIGEWIRGCRAYFLQKFQDNGNNICGGYHEPDRELMREMQQTLSAMPGLEGKVFLRGME